MIEGIGGSDSVTISIVKEEKLLIDTYPHLEDENDFKVEIGLINLERFLAILKKVKNLSVNKAVKFKKLKDFKDLL